MRDSTRIDQVPIVGLGEGNEDVVSYDSQVTLDPHEYQSPFVEGYMNNVALTDALMNMTQLMTDQSHVVNNHFVGQGNKEDRPQPNSSTPASRIRDFISMNPSNFNGTMVDEDTQGFINEVLKVLDAMGVTSTEKEELASY